MKESRHAPILSISLEPNGRVPLYRQLYQALRKSILDGHLKPGSRLPSSRSLADDLGVSRNTVQGALDQLYAEGYLQTKQGSGTFVSAELPDMQLQVRQSQSNRSITIRHTTKGSDAVALQQREWGPFQIGYPDCDKFPFATWTRLLTRHWRDPHRELLGYGEPRGYGPLRVAIAEYLGKMRSVNCSPDQILILANTGHAIALAARVLLKPGDPVWVENPSYPRARETIQRAGALVISVAVDEAGLNVERGIASCQNARMAYVTPSHQYPLGFVMSLGRRLALLDWARKKNAWILEDDYGSYFRYAGRPVSSLQGLDEHNRVLYIGTFSRVIFPAIRMCYLVVPSSLVDSFSRARLEIDHHTTSVDQAVLADFIAEGYFTRHIRRMRKVYAERQATLVTELRRQLASHVDVEHSQAGMHIVAEVPHTTNDRKIESDAAETGLIVSALSRHYARGKRKNGLVLGFGPVKETEIVMAVNQLAKLFV